MNVRVLIMSGYGINCERESSHAFELAGAKPDIIHINDLISRKKRMSDYDVMMFPGGFSYGDDTGAGNGFANRLKNNLWNELIDFIDSGKLVFGVCNGFQIMTHLGLFNLNQDIGVKQHALESNLSNRYECRWVHLRHWDSKCVFTRNIGITHIPVAHGEGRFCCSEQTFQDLRGNKQIVFSYCDSDGNDANGKYPINPNGAFADIAAICDRTGRIFGIMPHPERAIYSVSSPDYHLRAELAKRAGKKIERLNISNFLIFKNAVTYLTGGD